MCVLGYSGSSWESSFDSQCLEIIRGRGGPGVATATANQRAKKNFSFYIAHFSVLSPPRERAPEKRGSRRSTRGCCSGSPRSADRRRGGCRASSPTPASDNVCRDTLKHVDILRPLVCACTCTVSMGVCGTVDAKYPEISIARYHSTRAHSLSSRFAVSADAAPTASSKSSREFSSPTDTGPRLVPSIKPFFLPFRLIIVQRGASPSRNLSGDASVIVSVPNRDGSDHFPPNRTKFQVALRIPTSCLRISVKKRPFEA